MTSKKRGRKSDGPRVRLLLLVFGSESALKAGEICRRIGAAGNEQPQTQPGQYRYLARWRENGWLTSVDGIWHLTPAGHEAIRAELENVSSDEK